MRDFEYPPHPPCLELSTAVIALKVFKNMQSRLDEVEQEAQRQQRRPLQQLTADAVVQDGLLC